MADERGSDKSLVWRGCKADVIGTGDWTELSYPRGVGFVKKTGNKRNGPAEESWTKICVIPLSIWVIRSE